MLSSRARASSLAFAFIVGLAPGWVAAQTAPDTFRSDVAGAIQRALDVSPEVDVVRAERDYAAARRDLALASRFATDFNLQTAHAVAPGLKNLPEGVPPDEYYLYPEVRNDWEDVRPLNRFEADLIQPLYTWGQLSGSIRAARKGVDVEEASIAEKQLEVALRTGELYYGLLLARQLSRLTDRAGAVVDQAQREIERLLEAGPEDVDDADLFQVRITEQEFRRRVVEVEQAMATAQSAVRRQLFLPDVGQEELPANGTLRRGHGLLHLHDAAAEFLLGDAHLEKIRIVYILRSRFEQPLDLSLRLVDHGTSPIRQARELAGQQEAVIQLTGAKGDFQLLLGDRCLLDIHPFSRGPDATAELPPCVERLDEVSLEAIQGPNIFPVVANL